MGHLWFHTFHLPLCVTVINILLTQNTRPQWFTWANYKYFHTSRTKCPCSFFSLSHSHILPHNLSPLLLTNSQKVFFFFSIQLGLKLFLIQSPYPIFSTPPSRQTSLSHQAPCSPRLPSFLTLGLVPSRSGTAHPYQCRPVGRNPAVFIWEREERGRKEGIQRDGKRNRERKRQRQSHNNNNLYEGACCLYKNGRKWNK